MVLLRSLLRPVYGVLVLLACYTACASPRPVIPLEVEYAGCKAVLVPGPVCVLGSKRELRLWIGASPDARIELQVDGRQLDAAGEPVREGRRFSLIMPPGAKRVDVVVEAGEGRASWSLSLTESEHLQGTT